MGPVSRQHHNRASGAFVAQHLDHIQTIGRPATQINHRIGRGPCCGGSQRQRRPSPRSPTSNHVFFHSLWPDAQKRSSSIHREGGRDPRLRSSVFFLNHIMLRWLNVVPDFYPDMWREPIGKVKFFLLVCFHKARDLVGHCSGGHRGERSRRNRLSASPDS